MTGARGVLLETQFIILCIIRHGHQVSPVMYRRSSKDFEDLGELFLLEWHCLLRVNLRFFTFKYRLQSHHLREHTSHSPAVDRRVVVLRSQEELWSTVPNGHYYFVSHYEWLEWLMDESCETQVADFYHSG
jgi:hypothetical protein